MSSPSWLSAARWGSQSDEREQRNIQQSSPGTARLVNKPTVDRSSKIPKANYGSTEETPVSSGVANTSETAEFNPETVSLAPGESHEITPEERDRWRERRKSKSPAKVRDLMNARREEPRTHTADVRSSQQSDFQHNRPGSENAASTDPELAGIGHSIDAGADRSEEPSRQPTRQRRSSTARAGLGTTAWDHRSQDSSLGDSGDAGRSHLAAPNPRAQLTEHEAPQNTIRQVSAFGPPLDEPQETFRTVRRTAQFPGKTPKPGLSDGDPQEGSPLQEPDESLNDTMRSAAHFPLRDESMPDVPLLRPTSVEIADQPRLESLPRSQTADPAWNEHLQQLIDLSAAKVTQLKPATTSTERTDYIEKHVNLRLLYLMAGQQERAMEAIPGLDPATQEFWQQVFWAMAAYFDDQAMPKDVERMTETVTQLRAAIVRLQEQAQLKLHNANFCHKITSFGNYERFERDEFSPGQPVLVYAEVRNFKSEPTIDRNYRTILKSAIEIYQADSGDLVERVEFDAIEDVCRNRRQDYFHSYEFIIPQHAALGRHTMKLIVEDQLSQKVSSYTLNFMIK